MPRPGFVQRPARNGRCKANVRILQSFSSTLGGPDRLSWLEGRKAVRALPQFNVLHWA